jgi:hypothetical protein
MTVTWVIEMDDQPVERVRADLLVAPFFAGERPLRGAAGRLDWRLCGHLSEMLRRSAFEGAPGDLILVPTGASARAPRALLVGLGERSGFSPRQLRPAVASALAKARALRAGIVAVALPSESTCGIPAERAATAAVVGAGEALQEQAFTVRLRLIVEPDGMAAARQAMSQLVPRIQLEGVLARFSAAEPPPPPGGGVGVGRGVPLAPGAGSDLARGAAVHTGADDTGALQAKLPSAP